MEEVIKLGDRVVWRSSSNGFWAEKIGVVVFMGAGGWRPENAPARGWLNKEWRETIKSRKPDYTALCRLHPAEEGGYRVDPAQQWTSRQRYRFEDCNGIVVAVSEYKQLTEGTKQAKLKKPKKPLFYSPRVEARKGSSGLKDWAVGGRRPKFGKTDIPAKALKRPPTHEELQEAHDLASALMLARGNKTKAASLLGVSRGAFTRRLEKFTKLQQMHGWKTQALLA